MWESRSLAKKVPVAIFAADKVVRLDITVDEAGMEMLRSTPHPWLDRKIGKGKGPMNLTEKPYVKATVIEDGKVTHQDVGVRLRGSMGSWQKVDEKPGLFLNLDKFTKGQRFHGMEKVILHNSHQNPRFRNELLTGEVYRAAGSDLPARIKSSISWVKPEEFQNLKHRAAVLSPCIPIYHFESISPTAATRGV